MRPWRKSILSVRSERKAWGTFGRGQMVKEFDEVVFSAPVGEVQGPVQTQFGFHLGGSDAAHRLIALRGCEPKLGIGALGCDAPLRGSFQEPFLHIGSYTSSMVSASSPTETERVESNRSSVEFFDEGGEESFIHLFETVAVDIQ